ncbi:rhodanese-like domain-containing protein [Sedimentimonas flavescens]|uniref:rhodanese-like domain-containing protein n=1 Tax=Sedimentimonas flavescens TaxID=2851012 RepID=UPI0021A90EAA|nr:rhodanese-like domain-containing protein [Sedimentimonas flavescens]MCT2540818.1 rhodanese-like domain-containing protein [Sedimentimonas flavescens]
MNAVLKRPAPAAEAIVAPLEVQCALHTDCSDVHAVFAAGGDPGFVLLHTMGTPETYARRHVPRSVFLPHRFITEERMAEWPAETLFVVYCSGPHCNAAEQAALALAKLGRPVKIMLGGILGWEFEGYGFDHGA